MDRVTVALITFTAAVTVPLLLMLFVYVPVSLYNDSQCLKQGYPRGKVSIGLERYCLTLDGAVKPVVTKQ